jgi:hypothetical protein
MVWADFRVLATKAVKAAQARGLMAAEGSDGPR